MSSDPNAPRKVTLRAVAEKAGVSIGTASQALSGRGAVSAEAKERVEAVADQLGYVVNDVARALRTQRSLTLGMVVPDVTNPFFAELMRAVEGVCREHGLVALFGDSDGRADRALEYVLQFQARQVDGVILIGSRGMEEVERRLPGAFPVVAVDRVPRAWSRDWVGVDNSVGAELAVRHVVSLGHDRLAYVGGPNDVDTERMRMEGFIASAGELGASVTSISEGDFTLDSGLRQGADLLDVSGALPTAVIAANDLLALGVSAAARQRGLRLPADLSIIGFDDSALASLAAPSLTTVKQPIDQLARLAVDAVLARLDSPHRPREESLLSPELVVRESVASPRR